MNGTDALETISAAATVIASAENNRVPQASVQKRRWGSCFSLYWCFGSHKSTKRIGHAVLVPETTTSRADVTAAEHPSQPLSTIRPFAAPPSSPSSFRPSEPPSAIQSPVNLLSLTSVSAVMSSPGGPASMFAIGPYAYETQLVTPPAFSAFTTASSTAPYTPPPESVHLTTPSSPEVPFARLLEPNLKNGESGWRYPLSQYEFQSYQLQPGSPASHLISPSSGISGSGTSSPFPDREFAASHPFFLQFTSGNPSKLMDLDKIVLRVWDSREGSGAVTPDAAVPRFCDGALLDRQNSDVGPLPDKSNELQNDNTVVDHRVSFEITAGEVIRCVEKKAGALPLPESTANVNQTAEEKPVELGNTIAYPARESYNNAFEKSLNECEDERGYQKRRTITLGSAKEFNFDTTDSGNCNEHGSYWLAKEKVFGEERSSCNNWSFFPIVQTGSS